MKVEYRQLFLQDLKKLKNQPICQQVYDFVFDTLLNANFLQNLSDVKAFVCRTSRYQILVSDYRIGVELKIDFISNLMNQIK